MYFLLDYVTQPFSYNGSVCLYICNTVVCDYLPLSVCLYVACLRVRQSGLPFCRRTNGSIMIVLTCKHIGVYKSKEPTFNVNFLIPMCNCLTTTCVFQPLLVVIVSDPNSCFLSRAPPGNTASLK